jgi:hypothetical protein
VNESILANYSYSDLATIALPLNCSPQFSLTKKPGLPLAVCSPICGQWEEFSEDQVVAFTVTTTLLYIIHIVGAIVAVFFSCYNHKIMQVLIILQAK